MSEMGGAGDVGGERDRVGEHFRLFNEAVRRNDWTDFMATFAPDAVMTFEGVPVGPYVGRDAIAEAYATQPATDTMSCVSDDRDGDTDVVRFAWDAGGYGGESARIECGA